MPNNTSIPLFQHPIIETHCHLDYLKSAIADVIVDAQAVGVERIITISVSVENLATVKTICQTHNNVWGTQGIHPHDAKDFNSDVLTTIKHNLADSKLIAVGEIGLDYYYKHTDPKQQQTAFDAQLALAAELNLPVVIHTREADADTQAILKNHSQSLQQKGVIHSFTASQSLAEFCLSEGFHLGFNGISTFKNAQNVRDIISITPIERILLETDAPYLTPAPYRGKENAPKYLPFIAQKIAEVKNIDIEVCLRQCYQNSLAVFFS